MEGDCSNNMVGTHTGDCDTYPSDSDEVLAESESESSPSEPSDEESEGTPKVERGRWRLGNVGVQVRMETCNKLMFNTPSGWRWRRRTRSREPHVAREKRGCSMEMANGTWTLGETCYHRGR